MKILYAFLVLILSLNIGLFGKKFGREHVSSLLDAGLFATSSRVEEYSRQDWNGFYWTVKELRFELGQLTKEELKQAQKTCRERADINTAFVQLLEVFEEKKGRIYLIDPNNDSKLSGYIHLYALNIGDEWYAFDEQDTEDAILARKNLSHPIRVFYELIGKPKVTKKSEDDMDGSNGVKRRK